MESANALVQGISSEEKLISSAKQVASSTAQLLVSCKVKADPESASTKRLLARRINNKINNNNINNSNVCTYQLIFWFRRLVMQ